MRPSKKLEEAQVELIVQDRTIPCFVKVGGARRKKMALRILPNGRVELLLPYGVSLKKGVAFAMSQGAWLVEQTKRVSERPTIEISLQEGASLPFLGEGYALHIKAGKRGQRGVFVEGERLTASLFDPTPKSLKRALASFYKAQAMPLFENRIEALSQELPFVERPPKVSQRFMRGRWGSCSYRGTVSLNTALIMTPPDIIDYVVMHELCHLKEHNHSARYYALLDQYMPDWRARKKALQAISAEVMALSTYLSSNE